jgi:hypothetical protein
MPNVQSENKGIATPARFFLSCFTAAKTFEFFFCILAVFFPSSLPGL